MSLKQRFDALVRALNEQDASALEDILADQYRFTGTVAQHQNKPDRIKAVLENAVFRTLRFRNMDFQMLENTCLVYTEFQYEGSGEPTLWFGRTTFVFAKQADAWKLVAQHNSHVLEAA
jgi:ketosteroid isomerase-like protein